MAARVKPETETAAAEAPAVEWPNTFRGRCAEYADRAAELVPHVIAELGALADIHVAAHGLPPGPGDQQALILLRKTKLALDEVGQGLARVNAASSSLAAQSI